MRSQLVVTNHSLLAIDAVEGVPMLPEYDVVVVDEAHELVARVTQAATDELAASRRRARRPTRPAARRGQRGRRPRRRRRGAARRRRRLPSRPARPAARDARRRPRARARRGPGPGLGLPEGPRRRRRCHAGEGLGPGALRDRRADGRRLRPRRALGQRARAQPRRQPPLRRARSTSPDRCATGCSAEKTVVFTSATLKLGGDFDAVATSLGLEPADRGERWEGLDVGSPFDYQRQAILYVARHLPPPGRDGLTRRSSTRSPSWSTRPRGARSGCSPAAGPPRRPPSTSARRCRT